MSEQRTLEPVHILLVEDCPEQIRHVRQALMRGKFKNRLHTVGNSIEAMAYLRRHAPYQEAPEPGLVLLDFDLLQDSDIDILAELKTNAKFRHIPVVVLTDLGVAQELPEHIFLSVDYCISKPVELAQLVDAIRSIKMLSLIIVNELEQG